MKQFISHSLFAVSFLIFNAIPVSAQVSMSPLFARIEISDAGAAQVTFSVFNGSPDSIRYQARFQPFTFNKSLELIEGDTPVEADLSPYLRAAPLEFEVPANSEQTIRVVALVPPSLAVQELRSALVVEPVIDTTTPVETSEEGAVTGRVFYTYRFVAQIYASAPGGTAAVNLGQSRYGRTNGLQLEFSNDGNVSGISNTSWSLAKDGSEITKSETNGRYLILPESQRTVTLNEEIRLEPGTYTLSGTFGLEDGNEPPVVLDPQPFTKTFTVK